MKIERRSTNRTLKFLKTRMSTLLWGTDLLAIRFILSCAAILQGIMLFCDPTSLLVVQMIHLLPADTWASLFISQGVVMLWSLICNKRPSTLFWTDSVLGTALWTSSTILCTMYLMPPEIALKDLITYFTVPAGMAGSIWLTIASWWVLVRYCVDKEDIHYVA